MYTLLLRIIGATDELEVAAFSGDRLANITRSDHDSNLVSHCNWGGSRVRVQVCMLPKQKKEVVLVASSTITCNLQVSPCCD